MNALTEIDIPLDLPLGLRPSPKRPRKALVLAIVVLVAVAAMLGLQYLRSGSAIVSTDDAQLGADFVQISSKTAGRIRAVNVVENQAVSSGQALFALDPADAQLGVEAANIELQIAQAQAASSKASAAEARAEVGHARAELEAARAQADQESIETRRLAVLAATGAESKASLQQARAQAAKARADVTAKQALLLAAQARAEGGRAHQTELQAEIGAAQVRQKTTQLRLAETIIAAPVAGRVRLSNAQTGQFVQTGQLLARIVPVNDLYVVANYKETQISRIRAGQMATVTVDALPGVELTGKVESISPGTGASFSLLPPQNATGNFTRIVQRVPVLIRLAPRPELEKVLVPGLSLNVRIDTAPARSDAKPSRMARTAG